MLKKIGVVGEIDSILPFQLLGFSTFFPETPSEIKQQIEQLANEDYGIIYITESSAEKVQDVIARFKTQMTPAIILIPSHKGTQNIGLQDVQKNVERAVGQNIL